MKAVTVTLLLLLLALMGGGAVLADAPAQTDTLDLISLYERVAPSVVFIAVRSDVTASGMNFSLDGLGSGFVVDKAGHILTNNHVIRDAEIIDITFFDGTFARAEIVGTDPDSDLAVLRVDVEPALLQPVILGDSSSLRIGEQVVAIGNPFGQSWTMTQGIVSAMGRSNRAETGFSIAQMIQTDAAMNPGNSGGPLINLRGEVIGVNTMIFSEDRASAGVGFSVPSNTVRRVLPELIENGRVAYTWIGISGYDISLDVIELLELGSNIRGIVVSRVSEGGPAALSGLRGADNVQRMNGRAYEVGGDIITAINDTPLRGIDELINYLADNTRPGDVVDVTLIRNGREMNLSVSLEARPNRAR